MVKTTIATMFCLTMSGVAAAAPVSDGSIFLDEFSGTSLNTSVWTDMSGTSTPPDVSGGELTLDNYGTSGSLAAIRSNIGELDFSSSPDSYVAETRFAVDVVTTPGKPWRQTMLLSGHTGGFGDSNVWEAIGFDLRVRERDPNQDATGTTRLLTWHGWDNTNSADRGITLAELVSDQYYTLTAHVRVPDQEVDIYLDDSLISTQAMLVGADASNLGQIYPDRVLVGSVANDSRVIMATDYVSIGVPEPASLGLVGAGLLSIMLRRRR